MMKLSIMSPVHILYLCVLVTYTHVTSGTTNENHTYLTNDEQIFIAATDPSTFNFLQVQPDGEILINTEFDILLTFHQYELIFGESVEGRNKRKAIHELVRQRWANRLVSYEILLSDQRSVKVINESISHWTQYTCLTFQESTTEQSRIQFRDGHGCSSQLGMQGRPQPIQLAPWCRYKGIILHEIGHAIGFIHEQSRPDRDEFVKIDLSTVPPSMHRNFVKYPSSIITTYNVPYDYLSIMHYGAGAYPGSVIALDKSYQNRIGQRLGLSFRDIKLANVMYDCDQGCDTTECPDGGFVFNKPYKSVAPCQCWCDSGDLTDPLVLCSDPNRRTVLSSSPDRSTSEAAPHPMDVCQDRHPNCTAFKGRNACRTDMLVMMDMCPKACGFCGKGVGLCMDLDKSCDMAADNGLCEKQGFRSTLEQLCPASCGKCKHPASPCEIYQDLMVSNDTPQRSKTAWTAGLYGLLLTVLLFWFCPWC